MRSWSSFSSFRLCAVVVIAAMAAADASRVFKVGDNFGWRVPLDNSTAVYSHWATTKRFHVGDSLSFVYENDSVIEVDKWGFYHCNGSDPITAFDNGNSTVKLDHPGPFYFISGVTSHCRNGQRLIVEVMHFHRHHAFSSMAPSPLSDPSHSSSNAPRTALFASAFLALLSLLALIFIIV